MAVIAGIKPAEATFAQIRRLYRIARTWHARPDTEIRIDLCNSAKTPWKACAPVLVVGRDVDRRVWCRAYVKAWLATRPVAGGSADGRACVVRVNGIAACVVADGVFNPEMTGPHWVTTPSASPWVARDIARNALGHFIAELSVGVGACHQGRRAGDPGEMPQFWVVNPALYGAMQRLFVGLAAGAMKRVLAEVRPDALEAARRAGMPRALAWLQAGSGERERRLVDALRAYPVPMLWVMRQWESTKSSAGGKKGQRRLCAEAACERAITEGRSVVDAIAGMLRVTPGLVRTWHGVSPQRALPAGIMHAWPDDQRFPLVARLLGALPAHLRPRSRKEYRALFAIADHDGMALALRHNPSVIAQWLSPLTSICDPMIDQGRGLGDVATSLLEAVESVARVRGRHGLGLPTSNDVLAAIFRKRWRSLCELNARWHTAQLEATARMKGYAFRQHWPGAMRVPFVREGIEIVELTTGAALAEEGIEMRHCVGAYIGRCLSGQSRVLSIRRSEGDRLSTVELRRDGGARGFVVAQHYRDDNEPPASEAIAALRAWLDRVDRDADALVDAAWPNLAVGAVQQPGSIDLRAFWAQEAALPASLRRVIAAAL